MVPQPHPVEIRVNGEDYIVELVVPPFEEVHGYAAELHFLRGAAMFGEV